LLSVMALDPHTYTQTDSALHHLHNAGGKKVNKRREGRR